ncbi:MAG: general secretion pathway protein K [SAR86 cluster bacterium SAR86A]|uniref:Type II secretion system protein K n=1 Tax=SAR86 cluster bacterium SAR86A TaxID=1123866 RepID=J5K802_9GAMM|nr:MAG: general secretion pathway protein K [SAR86 cluster bacterium SAR86A]
MKFRNKGVVLISILLIVLLLSAVAITFGNKYLVSLKRAQYIEFQSLSLNAFRNVEAMSLNKIDKFSRFNSSNLTKENPLLTDEIYFEINGATIVGSIDDASNCFNINSLVTAGKEDYQENKKSMNAFRELMYLAEVDNNVAEEIIDQIIDWVDKNSNPRAYGLEDYYYSGPLHNPREFSGGRLLIDIEELKSIPSVRLVDWDIFKEFFCAYPFATDLKLNINTLDKNNILLLTAFFPKIDIKDSEYIIENIPLNGFQDINAFLQSFDDIDLSSPNGEILFTSDIFNIETVIDYEGYSASSKSTLIYGKNKNGYILSRTYNGI